jgi:hypothetical protein
VSAAAVAAQRIQPGAGGPARAAFSALEAAVSSVSAALAAGEAAVLVDPEEAAKQMKAAAEAAVAARAGSC